MSLQDVDLKHASRIYVIANTPLFLVRKLQQDPAVRSLSERYSGEEILGALREAVTSEPRDAAEAVLPYVLLVALSFKPSVEHLQQASGISPEAYSWYSYIVQALLMAYSPVQQSTIQVPATLSNPSVSAGSQSPSNIKIIDAA